VRTIGASESTLLTNRSNLTGRIRTRHRVRIRDNSGNWQTYQAQAIRGRIRRNKDEPVATAEITLLYRVGTNLSPFANAAKPIDLSRDIQIESAYLDAAGNPITWHLRFDGIIQSLEPRGKFEMDIVARDRFGLLMDRYTEQERTYGGGQRVDLVIQQILNDWITPAVTLFVPTLPGSGNTVADEKIKEAPVGEIIRRLALRIGWDISYRWDSGTSTYRLTLIDPARSNTTSTYTFTRNMFEALSDWGVDRTALRNKIEVAFGSGASRGSVVVSDSASITAHGTLYMRLGEDQGLRLQTSAQATTVANAVLSDLATPFITARYRVPYFPFAELNDVFTFAATNLEYDSNQVLAVVGIEEEWDANKDETDSWTVLTVRGKPVGGRSIWIDEGNIPTQPGPGTVTAPDAPTGLSGNFTSPDAVLVWNAVADAAEYEVVVRNTSGGAIRRTETVAASANPGYTYDLQKNAIDGTPNPSLTFEVRAIRSSAEGRVRSSAATVALVNSAPSAPASVTLVGEPLNFRASVPEPTFSDYLRTEWQADDNSGFTSPTNAASGPDWQGVRIGLESTTGTTWVRARFVDVFNQASGWTSASSAGVLVGAAHIADQAITVAKFASGIAAPQLYNSATLPTLPNSQYPQGTIIYNVHATNTGLWQNKNNSTWTRLVDGATDIVADSITAGQIAAGAVSTSELAANAITVEKLAVTARENYLLDGGFEIGASGRWALATGWAYSTSHPVHSGTGCLRATQDGTTTSNDIACKDGDPWFAEVWIGGDNSPNGSARVRITFLNASFGVISSVDGNNATNGGYNRSVAYALAPANTAYVRCDLVVTGRTTGAWLFDDAALRRANHGALTVDGTITAVKLNALELNAIQGTFGGGNNKSGLDNRGLRVYDSSAQTRVAVGDIGGLSWGSGTLAAGTYGFYAGGSGNVYLTDYPRLLHARMVSGGEFGVVLAGNESSVIIFATNAFAHTGSVASGRRLLGIATPMFLNVFGAGTGHPTDVFLAGWRVYVEVSQNGSTWTMVDVNDGPISWNWLRAYFTVAVKNVAGSQRTIDIPYRVVISLYDVP
jgi:hypothetical protein